MPRVYVDKDEKDDEDDPLEVDGLGGYYCVETISELRVLVGRLGPMVREIMINGVPTTPLDPRAAKGRIQIVRTGDAWGVRNRRFFYCRGESLDDVLRVHEELAHH